MVTTKKYKLQHDRPNCIGCGACAVIAPDFWEMVDDGKSQLLNSENKEKGWEERVISEKEFEENHEAAESCPVEVIHLIDEETGEKII